MSIIQRQSFLRTAISYTGMLLGAFSTIFIYPLELSSYGLSQFIYSAAEFSGPLLSLGIPFLTIKYFPYFRDDASGHRGFLGLLLLGVSSSMAIGLLFIWLFKAPLLQGLGWMGFDTQLFASNALFIVLLSAITVLSSIFETYLINFNSILVPSLVNNLLPKIGLPLLILAIYYGLHDELALRWGIVVLGGIGLLVLILYFKWINLLRVRIDWQFLRTMPLKEMGSFVLLSLASSVGYLLAFRIGNIMVPSILSKEQNGVYSIGNFIATAIEVPYISLAAIIAPFFADHIVQKNWKEVARLYHEYSAFVLIWGIYIFLGIVLCIDDLILLIPAQKKMEDIKTIVWFLGIAKIINMSAGLNLNILGYSRYFRLPFFSVLILAVVNVSLNFLFIPKWGISGAAAAILISILLFNLINILFFWLAFRIKPFEKQIMGILLVGTGSYLLIDYGIPFLDNPVLDILFRGLVLTICYLGAILWFRFSPEFNENAGKIWRRLRNQKS